ncbi:MAG: type II toxin-antitoxin system Phd/YefM family antitoxin [Isosphaeraceae bacterium]
MRTVGSYEAKTHLPQLLERVEHGEIITITRHGKPVARLVPAVASTPRPDVVAAIAAMQTFQDEEGPTLGDRLTIRDLIDEGRR